MDTATRNGIFRELDRETEFYSTHTKSQYYSHVSDYLDFVGSRDWKDRDVLYEYRQKLGKKGYNQSHINYLIRGPIGTLFRAYGLRIPVKLPRVEPAVYSPNTSLFFSEEQIIQMIKVARGGGAQIKAILTIATIYAPRAAEFLLITNEDVHTKKKVIVIHTVKHNLVRRHLIPECIQPNLFNYDYPTITEQVLRGIFDNFLKVAGIQRKSRQSFHAFRHALFDELSFRGFTDAEIYDFTGWQKVGTIGAYVRPLAFKPNNDQKIFANHPFLKYWE